MPPLWKAEFEKNSVRFTFDDATGVSFHGLMAVKTRTVIEAILTYELEKQWREGKNLIDQIQEALR